MPANILVFGADWCHDTQRTLHHLRSNGIKHRYINVEEDEAASEQVEEWNGGKRITPTVLISQGDSAIRLAEPGNAELDEAIQRIEQGEQAA